ncbi:MAG: DMT family transporter [Alistipes sp.]|nr:DMT family transporter [Alistipes sp.]
MEKLRPHLALLFANAIWAMDFPFYTIVLPRYMGPMGMVAASLFVAAVLSFIPLGWQWARWYAANRRLSVESRAERPRAEKVEPADMRKLVGAALLIGVLRKSFLMFGLSRTSPIDGSIIDTIIPILVLIISVILGMDRFSRMKIAGLTLGMAGAVCVVLSGASSVHQKSELLGNILIISSACVSALYMVLCKRLVSRYKPITVIRWVYSMAAIIALPLGMADIVHADYANIAHHALFPTLFVLIVPTFFPNLLLNYGLKFVAPTVTSIYTYLQPVLAIVVSVAMGLDKLHVDTMLFALLIFAGVGLVLRSYSVRETPKSGV